MATESAAANTRDSYKEAVTDDASLVRLWLDALEVSTRDEEAWRKDAQNAVDLYRQETGHENQSYTGKKKFNILHSNIETITPALYNSLPLPDVRRRFNDVDPIAKNVAQIQERCLSYSIDAYDFDHVMRMCVKDSELPGRAVARVRYKPYLSADGNSVDYQEVTCEHVPWKHFRRGPGNEWGDVPWIAFELFLTREELTRLSPKLGSKVELNVSVDQNYGSNKNDGRNIPEVFKRARVWEIWDKDRRQVLFIADSFKEKPIRKEDDPLDLENFFPSPRPIYGVQTADTLIPVVPYEIYRAQAEELERISQRIIVLTEAVKAKAIYDARMTEMGRLEQAEDADHIPIESAQLFADGSKLVDHIFWYPIEVIVGALEKLYLAREQIKQTIYEITGISDILRGQSVASETATAQNIKQQWGSLRIQTKQAEIQRFIRDLFRLKAELFASKFDPQVLSMMTGIQVDDQTMQLLRSDRMRGYRVDIESDSTIRADMTRNQQNMTMFLQGTAQFAQAMGPIVMQFKEVTPAVMEVFSAFARNFKLGKQAEDALDQVASQAQQYAQAQQQQGPTPEQQQAQAELQLKQQQGQQQMQLDAKKHQDKMMMDAQQHKDKMMMDVQQHQAEMAMRDKEINANAILQQQKQAGDNQQADANRQFERDKAGLPNFEQVTQTLAALSQQSEMLARMVQNVDALGQSITQILQEMNAPTQIVRDKAGRATGVKKGSRTMQVQRGPDGRAIGLQ